MTETILDKIVTVKKEEVKLAKSITPLASLKERMGDRIPRDFVGAVRGKGLKLIAEVKKASPSKGVLCPDFKPVELAQTYERNGAAAISVLTESKHFQGSLEHLTAIREKVSIPLLRKDFIFDEYQIYESAANGADAILLITALLEKETLEAFLKLGESLKLDCLVEVHNEEELTKALLSGARIIGINNRDLNTFKTDTNTTRRLRMLIPEDTIVVSESGINCKEDIKIMKECKVDAVLVGEALVTAKDIPAKMKELLG
ncbi:MAG: indole-3-glycerol phosphate synthase TrpC [Dehalococcoidales bacterium]|nr:indole-3-glycerol phosphate synthase TrpC [Dehalococcoidales bacterium]